MKRHFYALLFSFSSTLSASSRKTRLRIILTTPDVQLVRTAEIAKAELYRKIHEFRTVLQNPARNPLPLARELYDAVLGPAEADLDGAQIRTLMVSLDGALRYLPLSALHDGEKYVAETRRVVIFTEAAKTRLTEPPAPDWRLAGLGLSREVPGFSALPAVPAELEGIVVRGPDDADGVVPGVVFLDEAFSEERMIDALFDGYPVLHIASHFVFKPGNETDSFLLLGDGRELSLARLKDPDFDFNNVELLALSACETAMGGGKGADGREEVPPSAPSASRAGVLHIGDPEDPSAAPFRKNPKAPFAHPYYWGPFILMGHWL